MDIFKKLYHEILNSNMQDYDKENKIFEQLEKDLRNETVPVNMVKLAIDAIESVIDIRGGKEKKQEQGMRKLYYNLSKAQNLYEQVKILSEGTGTGWGSAWRGSFREIFKNKLSDDLKTQNPCATLMSAIKEDNNEINDDVESKKSTKDKIEEIELELESRNIENDVIKKSIVTAAIYLFTHGYEKKDLHFLGQGGFNTVFRIGKTNRVVKYCLSPGKWVNRYDDYNERNTLEWEEENPNGVSIDEVAIKNLEELLPKIKDPKFKKWSEKYLSKLTRINKKDIYEEKLAKGDLFSKTLFKRFQAFSNNSAKNKSLDSLLKKFKKAAKGLLVLHNSGYVHQDIKPENILHLPNPKYSDAMEKSKDGKLQKDKNGEYTVVYEISKKDNKIRYFKKYTSGEKIKISKNTINLSDYGLMRAIEGEKNKTWQMGTRGYMPLEDQINPAVSEDDVKKRDVFSLGMTYANLLCGKSWNIVNAQVPWSNYAAPGANLNIVNVFESWYQTMRPSGGRTLYDLYGKSEQERVYELVKLIDAMTGPRKDRPLMDDVINRLRKIEQLKKGNKP